MEKADIRKLSTEELVEHVRTLSAERLRAIQAGKPKDGNRMFDLLVAIERELRVRGIEAQRELLRLLDEPDLGTRSWVAASVLEFAPDEGVRVLTELIQKPNGLAGISAEMTLDRWKSGTWEPL